MTPVEQWAQWTGDGDGQSRLVRAEDCGRAAEALIELRAKPGLLVLDDLAGFNSGVDANSPHQAWVKNLKELRDFFNVSSPVLPVHKRHAQESADDLLPLVRAEIDRMERPLAAIVDMQWVFTDDDSDKNKARWFGLELIRLIKKAKPSLPVFVWSPIEDKQIMQRAMQLGASSCFNKGDKLTFKHDQYGAGGDQDNELDVGKLWFRLLEREMTRYQCPPVGGGNADFLMTSTLETQAYRKHFMSVFGLTESDLLQTPEPEVVRLLRALVPDAVGVEILRFFGEGQSGLEKPFVVRGRTASGRWLRPVQIKLSQDWRALAREGKGYRDVFAGSLGPSVAHVISGPFRLGEWCGMAQSFAAPEEAIRDISSKSTRSLEDWLRNKLSEPAQCRQLVDEVFDGVLDPLYQDNLQKRAKSVLKAFDRVSPSHLTQTFVPVPEDHKGGEIDLTPEKLSRKDAKARREMAYRRWRKVGDWFKQETNSNGEDNSAGIFVIKGMVIDTLEVDDPNPRKYRLRLIDPTLGIKVDLYAGKDEVAQRWQTLAKSSIKLVGLPVFFALKKDFIQNGKGKKTEKQTCLLDGWTRAIETLLSENGILEDDDNGPNKGAWKRAREFFHPGHPLDWAEEFHVGPTHGDLNLGNILLHGKEESQFPWLIDFDKAEDKRPVVFDLAKLEIEAYHKIAQELFWELRTIGCLGDDSATKGLLRRFELALDTKRIVDVEHLWEEYEGKKTAIPGSIKDRFVGLFAYCKQIYKRVENLGIDRREFLVGRVVYTLCCLKFKHLYKASVHPNAPFPAKILLWKLEFLLEALDAENGIVSTEKIGIGTSSQQGAIRVVVDKVRKARVEGETKALDKVLVSAFGGDEFKNLKKLSFYKDADGWEVILRLLRDKQIPGNNRWMRELLWYARDHGVAENPEDLAVFTKAIVLASRDPEATAKIKPRDDLVDYASTGRPGNTYPTAEMFKHLAEDRGELIKISSRGESGGTIDILEEAGISICQTREAVDRELKERRWAVVETSSELCEVDKILMKIRKEANCMKVTDLVMASISAKKATLGISKFNVQVVSGYDAKFPELFESGSNEGILKSNWNQLWQKLDNTKNQVTWTEPSFNSDKLCSWFNGGGDQEIVVFGKSLLAAKIWGDLAPREEEEERTESEEQGELRTRLPEKFCDDLADLLRGLDKLAGMAEDCTPVLTDVILDLSKIQTPIHLKGLVCSVSSALSDKEEFRDVSVILFKFTKDVRALVRVPFFDGLYSKIARSGHPLAALVFGKKWLAVVRPQSDLPPDLQAWCWRILREGFDEEND